MPAADGEESGVDRPIRLGRRWRPQRTTCANAQSSGGRTLSATRDILKVVSLAKALVVLAVVALVMILGLRWSYMRLAAEIYRDRLRQVAVEHERLRGDYNEAVRRTAVTELRVAHGRLDVVIRTLDGQERTIPTPFDPQGEIYVDFAVRDGRLWIRRVFDALTPPSLGVVIDPQLLAIDWNAPGARFGKAVYRSLSDGRWAVTVSGDGSLSLGRVPDDAQITLAPAPPVRDFEQISQEVQTRLDRFSPLELLSAMFRAGTAPDPPAPSQR